ncbi:Uncharacterised protein [Chromobacterium violaceum]|uniref:Uncharacterized protein n=1 Tax=Chromobacterium violaceum TaxID=536 RepID=A0A3S4HM16_CHRVL|nr:Uncharacterised protein [Chromobacterium violaceum]
MSGQALTLSRVTVQPSWTSLWSWEVRLAMRVDGPAVELRRSVGGTIYLNGFDLTSGRRATTPWATGCCGSPRWRSATRA